MLVRLRELRKSDYGKLLIEQKKSDAVIDSLGEPVIVTDSHDHVIKINRAARALFADWRVPGGGAVNLEHVAGGQPILRAVHAAVSMQRPVAADGNQAVVPIRIDGANRNFRLRATPIRTRLSRHQRQTGRLAALEPASDGLGKRASASRVVEG